MMRLVLMIAAVTMCVGTAYSQTTKPASAPASASAPAAGTATGTGKIVDANGTPVEGANITLCILEGGVPSANTQVLGKAKSGKDGTFTIEGLAPGTQRTLWVRRPSPGRVILSADVSDLKIEVGKTLDVGAVKVEPVKLKFEARPM
jgi:hypothetical protein